MRIFFTTEVFCENGGFGLVTGSGGLAWVILRSCFSLGILTLQLGLCLEMHDMGSIEISSRSVVHKALLELQISETLQIF